MFVFGGCVEGVCEGVGRFTRRVGSPGSRGGRTYAECSVGAPVPDSAVLLQGQDLWAALLSALGSCPSFPLWPKRHRPGRDGVAAIPGAGEEKEGSRHIPEAYSRRHFARAI